MELFPAPHHPPAPPLPPLQEHEPTGLGLATFEYAEAAAAAADAFDRPAPRRALDALSCGLTSATPRLHGAHVHVARAPEPTDVTWEHTACAGRAAAARRAASWACTAAIILAGAGVQYGLAAAAAELRAGRVLAEYAAAAGAPGAVAAAEAKAWRLRAVSAAAGVAVVTVNLLITVAVRRLSAAERWPTRSAAERWVMLKLSVSQLLNAFAAPVLAAYASGEATSWFTRGGLVEAAFFVQVRSWRFGRWDGG